MFGPCAVAALVDEGQTRGLAPWVPALSLFRIPPFSFVPIASFERIGCEMHAVVSGHDAFSMTVASGVVSGAATSRGGAGAGVAGVATDGGEAAAAARRARRG